MKRYLLMILFVIALNNCTGDKDISGSFNLIYTYFPLKVGNTWYFDVIGSDINPWIKRIIQQKLEINGKIYYTVIDIYGYSGPFPYSYTDTLGIDDKGRIFKYEKNEDNLLFDFSLENGKTYKYADYIVIGKKVGSIETTAGTFNNCIEMFFNNPTFVDDEIWYTFAPNVGLIKRMVGEGPTLLLNSYEF